MPAILIQLLQIVVPMVIQYGPKAVADVVAIFQKGQPTAADWEALRANAPAYESFGIPEPPTQPATPAPGN